VLPTAHHRYVSRWPFGRGFIPLWTIFSVLIALGASPVTAQPPVDENAVVLVRSSTALEAPLSQREIYRRTLHGCAWVVFTDAKGEFAGCGSGWLLDRDRKLMLTNHHVVAGHDVVKVYFPAVKDGKIEADPRRTIQTGQAVAGEVFLSDPQRDLALVSLASVPDDAAALVLAQNGPDPGDALHVIGNPIGSSGALWVLTTGHVRAVLHASLPLGGGQQLSAQVIESDLPVNQGDSGGPVVGAQGELLGVVSCFHTTARLVSVFIDVSELHAFLDEVLPLLAPMTAAEFDNRGWRRYQAGRYDLALGDLSRAASMEPRSAAVLSHRGWCFQRTGDYDTALADFNEALAIEPKLIDALKGRCSVKLARNELERAIEDATTVIRLDPQDAQTYFNRAQSHLRRREFAMAMADFDRAIQLDGGSALYRFGRGQAHSSLDHVDAALGDFEAATKLDERYQAAYLEAARILYHQKKNTERAMMLFTTAIECDRLNAEAWLGRGCALYLTREYDRALADFNQAIQLDAAYHGAYNMRGNVRFNVGRYAESLDDYTSAIRLDGANAVYYHNRGNSYYQLGRYEQAVPDFSEALRLNPKDVDSYNRRGNAYMQLGLNANGQADFAAALKLDPKAAAQHVKRRYTRYLKVTNSTKEPIEVRLQYQTKTVKGGWAWYPAAPSSGKYQTFTLQPRESTYLKDRDVQVHAANVRIWAKSLTSSSRWDRYRERDFQLAAPEGYLAVDVATSEYEFTP